MENAKLEGFEVEQKMFESLNVGDRFNFSNGKYEDLPLYEARERIAMDLYKKYKHLLVTPQDDVYGFENNNLEFIKKAEGLYQAMEAAKI